MKRYIILLTIAFSVTITLKAQIKFSSSLANSALNSNVTHTVEIVSVKNTQSNYGNNITANTSFNAAAVGAYAPSTSSLLSQNTTSFGYYSPFYAQLITVERYRHYYLNVPIVEYILPSGKYYQYTAIRESILPAYKYFSDGMPGYVPYANERPAGIRIDVGVTKPVPLQVDPAYQAYNLYNTRFIRTFSLNY